LRGILLLVEIRGYSFLLASSLPEVGYFLMMIVCFR
jgi:hypothetical protein